MVKHIVPFAFAAVLAAGAASGADALSDAAAVSAEPAPEAVEARDWAFKVAAGAESCAGNTEKDSATAHFEANKAEGDFVVLSSVDGAWAQRETVRADGTKDDERTEGNAKGETVLRERFDGFYVYQSLSGKHDGIADVQYRLVESLGLGTYFVDTGELKGSVEANYAHVEEHVRHETDDYPALRVAKRVDYRSGRGEGCSFFEKAEVLWNLDETDKYLVSAEAGIDMPVVADLSLTLKAVVDHDSDPAPGVEETDRKFVVQVGCSF